MNEFDQQLQAFLQNTQEKSKGDIKKQELEFRSNLKRQALDPTSRDWQQTPYHEGFLEDPDSPVLNDRQARLTASGGHYPDAPERHDINEPGSQQRYSGYPSGESGEVTLDDRLKAEAIRAQHAAAYKRQYGTDPTDEDLAMWERVQRQEMGEFLQRGTPEGQEPQVGVRYTGETSHGRPVVEVQNALGESAGAFQSEAERNAAYTSSANRGQRLEDLAGGILRPGEVGNYNRSAPEVAKDITGSVGQAAVTSVMDLIIEVGDLTGMTSPETAEWQREKREKTDQWFQDLKSLPLDRRREQFQKLMELRAKDRGNRMQALQEQGLSQQQAEMMTLAGDAGYALKALVTNPTVAIDTVAQVAGFMIPTMFAGGIAGKVTVKGLGMISKGGRLTAAQSAFVGSVQGATGIAYGALAEGAGAAAETRENILKSSYETLEKHSEVYRGFLEETGGDRAKARELTAEKVAMQGFLLNAALVGVTSPILAKFGMSMESTAARVFRPSGTTSSAHALGTAKEAVSRIAGSAGTKATGNMIEEGLIQEPGSQVIENYLKQQNIDPETLLTANTGEAVASGIVGGGAIAGGTSLVGESGREVKERATTRKSAFGPYKDTIAAAAEKHGVDPVLLSGLLARESNFDSKAVGDGGNSVGMGQFNIKGALADLNLTREQVLAMSPEQQIDLTAKFYRMKLDQAKGDPIKALKLYNGGGDPNYVQNVQKRIIEHGGGRLQSAEVGGFGKNKVTFRDENQKTGMQSRVLSALENVGMDITINSGHRDAEYNARVGGAKGSRHVQGDAADISIAAMNDDDKKELVRRLWANGFKRFITYSNTGHLHVDMHGSKAAFMHDSSGKNIANAPPWFKEVMQEVQSGKVSQSALGLNRVRPEQGALGQALGTAAEAVAKPVRRGVQKLKERSEKVEQSQESGEVTLQGIRESAQKVENQPLTENLQESALTWLSETAASGSAEVTADQLAEAKTAVTRRMEELTVEVAQNPDRREAIQAEINELGSQFRTVKARVVQDEVASIVSRASSDNPPSQQEIDLVADTVREGVFTTEQLKEFGWDEGASSRVADILKGAQAEADYLKGEMARNTKKGTIQEKFGEGVGSTGKGLAEHSKGIQQAIETLEKDNTAKNRGQTLDRLAGLSKYLLSQEMKADRYQEALNSYKEGEGFSADDLEKAGKTVWARDIRSGKGINAGAVKKALSKELEDLQRENALMEDVLEGHLARSFDSVKKGYTKDRHEQTIDTRTKFRDDIRERGRNMLKSGSKYTSIESKLQEIKDYKIPDKLTEQDAERVKSLRGSLSRYLKKGDNAYYREFDRNPELKAEMKAKWQELTNALKGKPSEPTKPSEPSPTPTDAGLGELKFGTDKAAAQSLLKIAEMFLSLAQAENVDQSDPRFAVMQAEIGKARETVKNRDEVVKKAWMGINGRLRYYQSTAPTLSEKDSDLTKIRLKQVIGDLKKFLQKKPETAPATSPTPAPFSDKPLPGENIGEYEKRLIDHYGVFERYNHKFTFLPDVEGERHPRLKGNLSVTNRKSRNTFVKKGITKEELQEYIGVIHTDNPKQGSAEQKTAVVEYMQKNHGVDLPALVADFSEQEIREFVLRHEASHVEKDMEAPYNTQNLLDEGNIAIEARANMDALRGMEKLPKAPITSEESGDSRSTGAIQSRLALALAALRRLQECK